MSLLDTINFKNELKLLISNAKSIFVASAYVKEKAVRSILENCEEKRVSIVARWSKGDLVSGASDLSIYELCRDNNWRFGIANRYHGKIYLIDENELFVGSANITQSGFAIKENFNLEYGVRVQPNLSDLQRIKLFMECEVVWMDDDFYNLICSDLNAVDLKDSHDCTWSKSILQKLKKPIATLSVDELFMCKPLELISPNYSSLDVNHDLSLLELSGELITKEKLKKSFRDTKVYYWLKDLLEERSASFGFVTKSLHSMIDSAPAPKRMEVKLYTRILFDWALFLEDEFLISKPNYSEVISLKENF